MLPESKQIILGFYTSKYLPNIECETSNSGRFDHEKEQLVKDKGEESHQRLWSGSANLPQTCHKVALQFLQGYM